MVCNKYLGVAVKQFNWSNPYKSARIPLFARNIVATSHPLAAQAGLSMMHKGGNAIDAAIAAAAAITVTEPVSCGLGGDAFALVWHNNKLHGLNASGPAPAAWNLDYFKNKYGLDSSGYANKPLRGWDTVTVPGVVAGWVELHSKFGLLPFEELLEPAISLAERGYIVTPVVARKWGLAASELHNQPGFAQTFMPNGRAPQVGELFSCPDMAYGLKRIAVTYGKDFYQGVLADKIVEASRQGGGVLNENDLSSYRPEWVEPIFCNYAGYTIHEMPPNGQGIAALIALGIVDQFNLHELPPDTVLSQHIQIEAMKLAFADVYSQVSDINNMSIDPSQLLDKEYLAQRAKLIRFDSVLKPSTGIMPGGGTIYLSTADEQGNMVSFIQSNYMGFGSGVVVPGTGISLQNRGYGFSTNPSSPNVIKGGSKPFHTIIPGFVSKNNNPVMSFGVMGGEMQPQGHLQTLVRMLSYNQQPQAACCAPRWKVNSDYTLDLESGMGIDVIEGLQALGHKLHKSNDPYMDYGAGQFIWRLSNNTTDGYVAASDSRRDGQAVGF